MNVQFQVQYQRTKWMSLADLPKACLMLKSHLLFLPWMWMCTLSAGFTTQTSSVWACRGSRVGGDWLRIDLKEWLPPFPCKYLVGFASWVKKLLRPLRIFMLKKQLENEAVQSPPSCWEPKRLKYLIFLNNKVFLLGDFWQALPKIAEAVLELAIFLLQTLCLILHTFDFLSDTDFSLNYLKICTLKVPNCNYWC